MSRFALMIAGTAMLLAMPVYAKANDEGADDKPKTSKSKADVEASGDDMTDLIRQAATALDPRIDGDWQPDGRPTLKAIRFLARDASITQEQLDAALPDTRRPKAEPAKTVAVVERDERSPGEGKPPRVVARRVVAIEKGYYGGAIREEGESFVFTGIPGKWMRPETAEEAKTREKAEEARAASPTPRPDVWAHEISKSPAV